MKFRLNRIRIALLAVAVAALAAACSSAASTPSTASSSNANQSKFTVAPEKAGGSVTVLEGTGYSGAWPYGLNPLTNVDSVPNQDFDETIFGQLFELGPKGQVEPDLATSYSFSPNAETVTIQLRQGVKFSNGDPFNAQAVLAYWDALLGPVGVKAGTDPPWEVKRVNPKVPTSAPAPGTIVATGPYTLVIHQDVPNAAFINQLFDSPATWIPDMKVYDKEGATQFAKVPIGAGPFTVVSDDYSNELVVTKNPDYWQAGHPYLDSITFKVVGSDESAYEAMLGGEAQIYEDIGTPQIITEAEQHFQVYDMAGTSPYDLQLNTAVAPFNNIKARQAIYAATNFAPILQHVFGNRYPVVEGFTGPGGICYEPVVPGYQGYDPTLAKKLIAETGLNKVTFNLGTLDSSVAEETTEALRSEWEALGMHVTISSYTLNNLVTAFEADSGKKWQSMIQTAGAYDPAGGVGVGFRFDSASPFSGVHSTTLDNILNEAQGTTNLAARCSYYDQAEEYIAKNYDGPFYFSLNPTTMSVKGVGGPGITSSLPAVAVTPTIPWEDIWYNPSGS